MLCYETSYLLSKYYDVSVQGYLILFIEMASMLLRDTRVVVQEAIGLQRIDNLVCTIGQ